MSAHIAFSALLILNLEELIESASVVINAPIAFTDLILLPLIPTLFFVSTTHPFPSTPRHKLNVLLLPLQTSPPQFNRGLHYHLIQLFPARGNQATVCGALVRPLSGLEPKRVQMS